MRNNFMLWPKSNTGKALLMSAFLMSLTACATQADPEPFMEFKCEQLRMMSEAQGPLDPFAANKVGPEPQAGLMGDREGLKTESIASAENRDNDTRAIRAAYLKKGC